jgi:hypothetical protein
MNDRRAAGPVARDRTQDLRIIPTIASPTIRPTMSAILDRDTLNAIDRPKME